MGTIEKARPVKLICPALAAEEIHFEAAEGMLQAEFGPVDLTSETWDFEFTDYYSDEMGVGLKRRIYSFREPADPANLARIKILTNEMERGITARERVQTGRVVNLDPGYVCHSKLVLATTKDYAHRIYLLEGIYAELTLKWRRGGFEPLATTYPDYRTEYYREFFALVRTVYLEQLRTTFMEP